MVRLRIVLVALAFAPSAGCSWIKSLGEPKGPPNTGPIKPANAEDLVAYLNGQADRLQGISYSDVSVAAREGWKPLPTLHGNLAASQPRNFRMIAEGKLAGLVDMGSNNDLFWVSLRVPTQQPLFVYASHTDFESGKAPLPGNIPFEPEWVMQALGMTRFPLENQYRVEVDQRARVYKLIWPAKTPGGMEVRKEVHFAVDDADAARNQPQVKKHLVRDARGNVICSAEVKSAKTVATGGTDPHTNRRFVFQYPTEVLLRWEEQKFEMTLGLGGATVNQQMPPDDSRRLFDLPKQAGANPINLAEHRFELPRR